LQGAAGATTALCAVRSVPLQWIQTPPQGRGYNCSGRRAACAREEIAAGKAASAVRRHPAVAAAPRPCHSLISATHGLGRGVGRPLGVGTLLGVGVGRGVVVAVAVAVGVAVTLGVGVTGGVGVLVGVGVGACPPGNTRT
jgi:hypothetical protein